MRTGNTPQRVSVRFKPVILIGVLLVAAAVVAVPLYSVSSSAAASASQTKTASKIGLFPTSNVRYAAGWGALRSFLPVPTSSPETIATYAVDCTTPKTTFTLGETVCAQTEFVSETNRFVNWLSPPDSHVAYGGPFNTLITTNAQQNFYYTPQVTGTWKATIASPSDSSIVPTVFTVSAPPPPPSFVFETDCTTPQSNFVLGNTVCAKVANVPLGFFPYRLTWIDPAGNVRQQVNITTDPQSNRYVIPNENTTTIGGNTFDNRGTWMVSVVSPFDGSTRSSSTFVVKGTPVADVGVGVSVTNQNGLVPAGANITYSVTVFNSGPDDAQNVQLATSGPTGSSFGSLIQSDGPIFTCAAGDSPAPPCTISSLSSGSVATFLITYATDSGGQVGDEFFNNVTVSSSTADSVSGNNSVDAPATVAATSVCALTCPDDITLDSTGSGEVVTYTTPSSTGSCGTPFNDENGNPVPVISCNAPSGSFFPLGTSVVVCTSQTGATCSFRVTVNHPGSLSITLNGANPLAVECGDDFSDPGATAVDAQGQSVPVDITVPAGFDASGPAIGSYVLTYTATSGSDSVSTTRTVNVADTKAPQITISGSNPFKIEQGTCLPFVDPGVSANDGCTGSKPVSSSISGPGGRTSIDTNTAGTYTITYSATDGSHTATASRTVLVGHFPPEEQDLGTANSPPTIKLNGGDPETHEVTAECGKFVDPGATATSACGAPLTYAVTGTVVNAPGTYTLTYTATDGSESASVERTVTITDDLTAPTITVNGANPLTVECHGTLTDPGATAHDACAGDFPATADTSGVNVNAVGTYTITYTATDPTGHAATPKTRTVNVVDTTPPTITTCPAPRSANANSSCQAAVPDFTASAVATDLCGGSAVTITQSPAAGTLVGPGPTTVTITAKDASNNSSTCETTFTVTDVTPPTFTFVPANVLAYTGPGATTCDTMVDPGTATATDNCGPVTITRTPSGNTFPVGTTTITWTAKDGANNTTTATQTVTVVDNTSPTITLNGNTPSMWPPDHAYRTFNVTDFVTSVFDNCGGVNVGDVVIEKATSDEAEDADADGSTLNDIVIAANCKSLQLRGERAGTGDGRVYTITFRLTDTHGNTTRVTANVVVAHNTGETPVNSGVHYTVNSGCQ